MIYLMQSLPQSLPPRKACATFPDWNQGYEKHKLFTYLAYTSIVSVYNESSGIILQTSDDALLPVNI